jgi:hypothetical protein
LLFVNPSVDGGRKKRSGAESGTDGVVTSARKLEDNHDDDGHE